MGTSFQFCDGVQLDNLATLSSEILILNWAQKKLLWRPGATFETIMDTLIYNSTNLHRLTLSQCGKAFGLSATPIAY